MATTTRTQRYRVALQYATHHRAELSNDTVPCACFFCFHTFSAAQIQAWIDNRQTALCPRCGINAVISVPAIGNALGLTVTYRVLRRLNELMFGPR